MRAESRSRWEPRRSTLAAPLALLLVVSAVWTLAMLSSGSPAGHDQAYTGNALAGASTWHTARERNVGLKAQGPSQTSKAMSYNLGIIPQNKKYDGLRKRHYIRRLQHRRWAAQSKYPRIWGFVDKWDDVKGEGVIISQEKDVNYLVIRDEIGRSNHNHKTLQLLEMVEFFASDEVDGVAGMPLALNVSAPYGACVKGSEEYRNVMLRNGPFPKKWADTPEEYEWKRGEFWLRKPYNCE